MLKFLKKQKPIKLGRWNQKNLLKNIDWANHDHSIDPKYLKPSFHKEHIKSSTSKKNKII